ncbi:MAG: PEP-CTERM sorting domain-containing protein [Snowella sp.]|nr:PEP-CTERM sorting domain-containing protein [Snowella sp.]
MTMTMKKVFATGLSAAVLSVGGLVLSAANAQAATISHSGNLFSNVTQATVGSTQLLKFDSALGTLTGVTITSQVSGSAALSVFNSTGTSQAFNRGKAEFDFNLVAPQISVDSTAGAYNLAGTVQPGVTGSFSGPVTTVDGSYNVLSSDLSYYIGDGTTTFTATGDLSDGFYSGRGASGVFFSGTSVLSANAIVTYTYTEKPPAPPVAAVPEPLTILGAATAVGFGAAFKRRALKNSKA